MKTKKAVFLDAAFLPGSKLTSSQVISHEVTRVVKPSRPSRSRSTTFDGEATPDLHSPLSPLSPWSASSAQSPWAETSSASSALALRRSATLPSLPALVPVKGARDVMQDSPSYAASEEGYPGRQGSKAEKAEAWSVRLPDEFKELNYWAAVKLFNMSDILGNGRVEKKPFTKMLANMTIDGRPIRKQESSAIFDSMDSDKAGIVTRTVFLGWVFRPLQPPRRPKRRDSVDAEEIEEPPMELRFSVGDDFEAILSMAKKMIKGLYSEREVVVRSQFCPAAVRGVRSITANIGRGMEIWDRFSLTGGVCVQEDPFVNVMSSKAWVTDTLCEILPEILAVSDFVKMQWQWGKGVLQR